MRYTAKITISLKQGMLDPEANAIRHALGNLGLPTESVASARQFTITYDADDEKSAKEQAEKFCLRLLANPVIHRYSIEVTR